MIVTQLSLAEYFDLIVERATYGGYKWVIMFIGRKAEAEKIYNEIENCWASLNDLTNNRIAFVFSASIHIRDSHRLSHLTALNSQVGIGLGVGGDLQRNIRAGSVDYGTNRIAYAHISLFDGNTVKVEVIARNHRRIAGIGKLILQTVDFQLRN